MEHGIAIKCALGMNSRVLFLNMNFDSLRVDQSLIGLLWLAKQLLRVHYVYIYFFSYVQVLLQILLQKAMHI